MKLTRSQITWLKKLEDESALHAAMSLSKMLNMKMSVRFTSVRMAHFSEVAESLGGATMLVAAVYFRVVGEMSGSVMFVFPMQEALRLVRLLVGGKRGKKSVLDEFSQSALKELGNIALGSYLTTLSEMTRVKMVYSVPGLAMDMLHAVMDGVLAASASQTEHIMVLRAEFLAGRQRVNGYFVFLPDPTGLKILLGRTK